MIYFIEAVGAERLKIGFTEGDPYARMKGLQTGCPHTLRLVATMPGDRADEAAFHELFSGHREQGEWFRIEGELKLYLWLIPRTFAATKRLSDRADSIESDIHSLAAALGESLGRIDELRERADAAQELQSATAYRLMGLLDRERSSPGQISRRVLCGDCQP